MAAQVVGDDAEVAGESTADLRREAEVALREAVDEDERGTDRIAPFTAAGTSFQKPSIWPK